MKPSTFAMTLRKHLLNGVIKSVAQHEFDRILKLNIGKGTGEYTLVIEFFSDGNIILVNPDEGIVAPLISQRWSHRVIKTNEIYSPPPGQVNPFDVDFEEFKSLIRKSKADLVRTLAVNLNLGGIYAEEICKRAGVDKNTEISDLDDGSIYEIFEVFSGFLKIFREKSFQPVLLKKNGVVFDVLPFEFKSYEDADYERIEWFVRGLDIFIDVGKTKVKKTGGFEEKIERLDRQLRRQMESITELTEKIELKKLEGDLIYLNYKPLEDVLAEIKEVLELKDKEDRIARINENDIVKVFDPTDNLLIVNLKDASGEVFEVKIDFRKSVAENAENAYDANKKLKNKLEGAEKSVRKTKSEIQSLKKKIVSEEDVEDSVVEKGRVFWFERYRWFVSSDGNVVVGGRDAKNNEQVVKKYLREGDRYAHADVQGASSVVIKNKGVDGKDLDISEKTLEEACVFAASFSKAWKQFAEAQAYWVLPEQVSKTPQSGEFVPKGAFIIRGKRNYLRCKLELAVGVVEIDKESKVMCGPIDSVKNLTDKYVVINPGDVKKSDLAHKLVKVLNVSVDSIDRVLPPGGMTIVETVGFRF
jgi:predicted ribosome quality control (RQC) complex YloA/Tae2 family protein